MLTPAVALPRIEPRAVVPAPRPASGACTPPSVALVLLGAVLSLFLIAGVWLEWMECDKLARFRPVEATVVRSEVERPYPTSDDGGGWRPRVRYEYVVDGMHLAASHVTPLRESRGREWAYGVAARYDEGARVTAYYDPDAPEQAFLLRERSTLPWLLIALPLVLMAVAMRIEERARRIRLA